MANTYTEADYEQSVMELLDGMDYEIVYGPDVERNIKSPLYDEVLEDYIRRLNPDLPSEAIADALFKLRNFENGELIQRNVVFMDYLQNGVPVRYHEKGEERSSIVYLVDYDNPDNNSFIAANQWTFVENSQKRPDVILFLNGLPIVIIELKSPSREETNASEAFLQLRNYMQEIPSMFIYNAICVMSDMMTSKAGTITSGEDRFMEWKRKDGSYENTQYAQFDTFFEGIFERNRLLDILKNFICFSNEGLAQYKILAGYHQYFAVKKAVASTARATETDGKGGVFWHTQGSGKSLSMVFYAHALQSALNSPTIVVLTDRNDLDDQLYGQFAKCKDFLRQEPIHAENRDHLKRLLAGRKANGIIFTTMQKFEESDEPLSERRNIVVMADEAHRSQYGLTEKIKKIRNKAGEEVAKRVVGTAWIKLAVQGGLNVKFELNEYKSKLSDEEILNDVKVVARKLNVDYISISTYKLHGKYSQTAIKGHFGTWKTALSLAGLRTERLANELKIITDDEYYADLKRVADIIKMDTVPYDKYDKYGRYSATHIIHRFGKWNLALAGAGLNATGFSKDKITHQQCFDEIERMWRLLGRQPTSTDIIKNKISKYSIDAYKRRFGGWRKALEAFIQYINATDNVDDLDTQNFETFPKTENRNQRIDNNRSSDTLILHRTSRNINTRLRFKVLQRDHFKCCACGASPAKDSSVELHVDHIVPWSKGGETIIENLQTLCSRCNLGKNDVL